HGACLWRDRDGCLHPVVSPCLGFGGSPLSSAFLLFYPYFWHGVFSDLLALPAASAALPLLPAQLDVDGAGVDRHFSVVFNLCKPFCGLYQALWRHWSFDSRLHLAQFLHSAVSLRRSALGFTPSACISSNPHHQRGIFPELMKNSFVFPEKYGKIGGI